MRKVQRVNSDFEIPVYTLHFQYRDGSDEAWRHTAYGDVKVHGDLKSVKERAKQLLSLYKRTSDMERPHLADVREFRAKVFKGTTFDEVAVVNNPSITSRISEAYKDVKHAITRKAESEKALRRLEEAQTPARGGMVRPERFGLGEKRNPYPTPKRYPEKRPVGSYMALAYHDGM